ncbi:hypothetical protein CP09DC78_0269A, partial [Chlamydia psittaci 09DC78]
MRGGGGP